MALSKTDELSVQSQPTPEGFQVITVVGWVTVKNKATFEETIDKSHGIDIILDLTGVQYMDSSGLGSLLKSYVAAQKYGGRVALAGLIPRVRDLLQLTKIEPLFRIFPTPAEAIQAFVKEKAARA